MRGMSNAAAALPRIKPIKMNSLFRISDESGISRAEHKLTIGVLLLLTRPTCGVVIASLVLWLIVLLARGLI
jgi:hypothetical protein